MNNVLKWISFVNFIIIICTALWTITTIQRMKYEQAMAIFVLNLIAERAGLKELIDDIQNRANKFDKNKSWWGK